MDKKEVKAEPWKAIKYHAPFLLFMIFYIGFNLYAQFIDLNCNEFFGIPFSYLSLFITIYGFAFGIFIASIYQVLTGYKILRFKVNPPPGIPFFFDTKATYGFRDKLNAIVLLILYPAISVGSLYYGNVVFEKLIDNRSLAQLKTDCMKSHNQANSHGFAADAAPR